MRRDRSPTDFPPFYPIVDTAAASARGIAPETLARALARAGAGIAQFRHKGPYGREALKTAARVGRILRDAGALFIVNDRTDAALLFEADGVHLGQDDLPPREARALLEKARKPMLIGFSTHDEGQLREADAMPADYLAIGPIFPTRSKLNPAPVVGLEELRRLRRLTSKPLVAVGGITRENAGRVLAAGADSVAVVSDFLGPDMEERLREWRRAAARER